MNMRRGAEFESPVSGLKQILEEWHKIFPYKYEIVGENPKAIILGEEHNIDEIVSSQASLITAVKPEIVLYEPLHAWQYNPQTKVLELIPGRKIERDADYWFEGGYSSAPKPLLKDAPDQLKQAASDNNSWIIGCDLTYAEVNEIERHIAQTNPDKYRFEGRLIKKSNPKEIINYYSPEINPFRDKLMAEMILKYQKQSSRPLIAILGWKHAARIKKTTVLEQAGLEYAVVRQDKKPSDIKKQL